jgi:transcriptional regulator with XRE-family HTH domain
MRAMPQRRIDGAELLRLRSERGWSQRELAERAEIGQVNIARYETHERVSPTAENLLALAKALEVAPEALLTDAPLPEPTS